MIVKSGNTDLAHTFNLLLCKSEIDEILVVVIVAIHRRTATGILHIVQWHIHFIVVIVKHYGFFSMSDDM